MLCSAAILLASAAAALDARPPVVEPPAPAPAPVVTGQIREGEKPVETKIEWGVVEENAFFAKKRAVVEFVNPNSRAMSGELVFNVPDGAVVCGYSLEIGGEMVPGVVCEKEKARVAFENETRKGVDPGIAEQVKGNVWKTRIFPLSPKKPRKAWLEVVEPKASAGAECAVCERDGDDVFVATAAEASAERVTIAQKIAVFAKGTIVWDASMSAKPFAAAWRKKLEALPEKGEWALVVFRNDAVAYAKTYGFTKETLLEKIDAIEYDGGTDIAKGLELLSADGDMPFPALLFTDEIDTLGLDAPKYEELSGVTVASRDDAPARAVEVRRLAKDEKIPDGVAVKESRLLATVWASRRMIDLASQADSRKDEFLALGRKYGVAGPGLSLIVLERLDQWLEYKIEPPESLSIHAEWVKRRAAEDDPIAAKKAKAEHEQSLLRYWEERVKWWKDPKPPKHTPKSGVFDGLVSGSAERNRSFGAAPAMASAPENAPFEDGEVAIDEVANAEPAEAPAMRGTARRSASRAIGAQAKASSAPGAAGSGAAPTVTLKAWDPKTPYIDALNSAGKGGAYMAYLKEREKHGQSPAFYLDCASWFFKAGEKMHAERILSNLAEFRLEDAALWRSMGWRAREAGSCDLAVLAFRKVLKMRGEEAQSRRDLALVLMERGKKNLSVPDLEEAMKLFADAAFNISARRSGRRGNDFQTSVVSLEELNGLISWIDGVEWPDGGKPAVPEFDSAYRRDLPVKLRIVMSWDADRTDIDLHVLEPNGEECYYGHRRTAEGGFVSEDVTTGYGPEEYLKKELETGVYKVMSNYFASHQTALTGATTVTATVYTDWGTAQEKSRMLTIRLDKPKSKHLVGQIELRE